MPNTSRKQKGPSSTANAAKPTTGSKKKRTPRRNRVATNQTATNQVVRENSLALLTTKVCSLVDPFCPHSYGAKYPDRSSVRTLAFPQRMLRTFMTDGNGFTAFLFNAQYFVQPFTTPVSNIGTVVSAWNDFPGNTAMVPNVNMYRIVSAGLKIKNICAPLSSAGMVHVRVWPAETLSNYGVIDVTSLNATYYEDIPLQDCKDVHIVIPRTSQRPETFYISDNTVVINSTTKGFCVITVAVSGAPAGAGVLAMEYVLNYEVAFPDSDGGSQLTTPPPKANTLLTDAAAQVTSSIQPVYNQALSKVSSYVATKAKGALTSLLTNSLTAAVGSLAL